jgi:glycosyltransferase involved in cell wall biosynthesis
MSFAATSSSAECNSVRIGSVRPKVSVGVPVYNGERYLAQCLDSILAQSYPSFELIISDNGSTDSTESICRRYAAADSRIRYTRYEKTRGVTWNFREVVHLSSGEYFLWMASDDSISSDYIERCLKVVESDTQVVLCYSQAVIMDENGTPVKHEDQHLDADSIYPEARFRQLIRMDHNCGALFGLMRADVLKRTPIHGDFADSDRCVLAELALYGRFHHIPEFLFSHREHPQRVTRMFPSRQQRAFKLHEKPPLMVFPHFRQFWEYVFAIWRAPLSWGQRFRCWLQMMRWVRENARRLLHDLRFALSRTVKPLRRAQGSA